MVVIDPLFSLGGDNDQVQSMLLRLVDYLKGCRISAMCTATMHDAAGRADHVGVSSLMDAWIELRSIEELGRNQCGIHVVKARGIAHSNRIWELSAVTHEGVALRSPYLGSGGVLSGSARLAQEMADREAKAEREFDDAQERKAGNRGETTPHTAQMAAAGGRARRRRNENRIVPRPAALL